MRSTIIVFCMLLGICVPAAAQVSVSIGINLRSYPDLVPVPGYPVYYAPQLDSNFFFYDGLYWVYAQDRWYSSSWYDGPWDGVDPEFVPYYVLRVPVRYYRQPPLYFRGWVSDAPPRWGEHWGRSWEQRRAGWDRWDRASVPAPAPLPTYQRNYSGDRYPRGDQQRILKTENYRYQPRETLDRQKYQQPAVQVAPAPRPARSEPAPPAAERIPQPQQRSERSSAPRESQPREPPSSRSRKQTDTPPGNPTKKSKQEEKKDHEGDR